MTEEHRFETPKHEPPPRWSLALQACTWLDMTSHTPSQARITNLSSGPSVSLLMSGCAVMIWCSGGRSAFCLYFKSPIARDKFRFLRG